MLSWDPEQAFFNEATKHKNYTTFIIVCEDILV